MPAPNPPPNHLQIIRRLLERATDERLKFEILDRASRTRLLTFTTYVFAPIEELNQLHAIAKVFGQKFRCEFKPVNMMMLRHDPAKETEEEKIVRKTFRTADRFGFYGKEEDGTWVFRTLDKAIFEETQQEIEALKITTIAPTLEVKYKPLSGDEGHAQIRASLK